jgi:integrase
LFSTVYALMSQVVLRIQPSGHAAYRAHEAPVGTSVVSVYHKLQEIETHTIAQDRLFAAIFLGFGTGLRRGEVLALRWKDVDVKTDTLQVRQTLVRVTNHHVPKGDSRTRLLFQEPKTSQSRRTIPIPEECLAALKQRKARQAEEKLLLGQAYQDHGLVFCQADGQPIDPRNFLRSFDRIIERAGLPPIRFHDARQPSATLMLELGESPKTVQTMLGHSRVAITLDIRTVKYH